MNEIERIELEKSNYKKYGCRHPHKQYDYVMGMDGKYIMLSVKFEKDYVKDMISKLATKFRVEHNLDCTIGDYAESSKVKANGKVSILG